MSGCLLNRLKAKFKRLKAKFKIDRCCPVLTTKFVSNRRSLVSSEIGFGNGILLFHFSDFRSLSPKGSVSGCLLKRLKAKFKRLKAKG